MPTYAEDDKTAALFSLNHVIARFGVPQSIVTNHGSHFCNQIMEELSAKLGFHHENSTPYYPQVNGQVESINKVLKTILRRMVGDHKSNWHHILFSAIWITDFGKNNYWFHTFSTCLWTRSCLADSMSNSILETCRRTSPRHFCRGREIFILEQPRRN